MGHVYESLSRFADLFIYNNRSGFDILFHSIFNLKFYFYIFIYYLFLLFIIIFIYLFIYLYNIALFLLSSFKILKDIYCVIGIQGLYEKMIAEDWNK